MKTCTKCKEVKPLSEFRKRAVGRDGLRPHCKSCAKIADAAWRDANPDKVKARSAKYCSNNKLALKIAKAKWYAENPEKRRAVSAKWRAEHPEETKVAQLKYRTENANKVSAATAKWKANNLESLRIYSHNRRSREREAGGTLSKCLAERLFKLQRGKCPCCNQPLGDDYHMDHIMPLALGGSNTDDNIQLLRATCNHQKHAAHPVDFMQSRGFLL